MDTYLWNVNLTTTCLNPLDNQGNSSELTPMFLGSILPIISLIGFTIYNSIHPYLPYKTATSSPDDSANIIQKIFRGFVIRRNSKWTLKPTPDNTVLTWKKRKDPHIPESEGKYPELKPTTWGSNALAQTLYDLKSFIPLWAPRKNPCTLLVDERKMKLATDFSFRATFDPQSSTVTMQVPTRDTVLKLYKTYKAKTPSLPVLNIFSPSGTFSTLKFLQAFTNGASCIYEETTSPHDAFYHLFPVLHFMTTDPQEYLRHIPIARDNIKLSLSLILKHKDLTLNAFEYKLLITVLSLAVDTITGKYSSREIGYLSSKETLYDKFPEVFLGYPPAITFINRLFNKRFSKQQSDPHSLYHKHITEDSNSNHSLKEFTEWLWEYVKTAENQSVKIKISNCH